MQEFISITDDNFVTHFVNIKNIISITVTKTGTKINIKFEGSNVTMYSNHNLIYFANRLTILNNKNKIV
jgi:N-methylhydantoinase B/oxoprolinase/acetone carboxylase alpha subunit